MWNVPNILTMARLGLLPVVVVLIWPGIESRETCLWAAVIFSGGQALDVVDGYIARKFNLVTVFGKFLDPLADKLYYIVTLIALLQLPGPRLPPWVVMVVIARELAITGLRGIAATEGVVIAAGEGGKVKTSFATVGAGALLVHYTYMINWGFMTTPVDFHVAGLWCTYISLVFSLTSGLQYMVAFFREVNAKGAAA